MKIYINALSNISPQPTFEDGAGIWQKAISHQGIRLECVHPEYKEFFKSLQLRRMSKMIRMGLTTALECIKKSGVQSPGAIVVGTGLGCMAETEKFLHLLLDRQEQMLNPSPFIFSTHNTIAAQIAIAIKCHAYNATYSNKGFSFENALHDAMMLLREGRADNVLVGGIDEITEEIFAIRAKMGIWKREPVKTTSLYDDKTQGTIAGEGSAFFMLGNEGSTNCLAVLSSLAMLWDPDKPEEVSEALTSFLADNGIQRHEIDLVITGDNGDPAGDNYYEHVREGILKGIDNLKFKHLCGEYYTSGAFGLWLASMIIKKQEVPPGMKGGNRYSGPYNNVLLYNHYGGQYHSFYLLTNVKV